MSEVRITRKGPRCRFSYLFDAWLQHQRRRYRLKWDDMVSTIAESTKIARDRLVSIINGRWPTEYEIEALIRHLNWSIGFVFSSSDSDHRVAKALFFEGQDDVGSDLEREFDRFYIKLLLQKEKDDKEKDAPARSRSGGVA